MNIWHTVGSIGFVFAMGVTDVSGVWCQEDYSLYVVLRICRCSRGLYGEHFWSLDIRADRVLGRLKKHEENTMSIDDDKRFLQGRVNV